MNGQKHLYKPSFFKSSIISFNKFFLRLMLILSDQTCFLLQVLASSFISSHSILIETNSSRLLFELDETLEIKTSTLFNLVFGSNATLSCSFFFYINY